jgi:hypothetical protein
MYLTETINRSRLPSWSQIFILLCLGWMFAVLAVHEQTKAQDAQPPAKKPPLSIAVDPCVELMGIIFRHLIPAVPAKD